LFSLPPSLWRLWASALMEYFFFFFLSGKGNLDSICSTLPSPPFFFPPPPPFFFLLAGALSLSFFFPPPVHGGRGFPPPLSLFFFFQDMLVLQTVFLQEPFFPLFIVGFTFPHEFFFFFLFVDARIGRKNSFFPPLFFFSCHFDRAIRPLFFPCRHRKNCGPLFPPSFGCPWVKPAGFFFFFFFFSFSFLCCKNRGKSPLIPLFQLLARKKDRL